MPETIYREDEIYLTKREIEDQKWTPIYAKFEIVKRLVEEIDIDTVGPVGVTDELRHAILNLVRVLNTANLAVVKNADVDTKKRIIELTDKIETVTTEIAAERFGHANYLKKKKH